MSDDLHPFAGVTIETHVFGRMRTVTSVGEAAEILLHNWPEAGRGKPIPRSAEAEATCFSGGAPSPALEA
ncbi:MAG: DUF982 domain-containing protein [Microvirga sp.]